MNPPRCHPVPRPISGNFIHVYEYVYDNGPGSGFGSVRLYFENNPQPYLRYGTIRIAGHIVTVRQLAPGTDIGGDVSYYHTDAIGSVRMITDATGAVVERHDYQPFGVEFWNSQTSQEPLRFAGKEKDRETEGNSGWTALNISALGFTRIKPVVSRLLIQ